MITFRISPFSNAELVGYKLTLTKDSPGTKKTLGSDGKTVGIPEVFISQSEISTLRKLCAEDTPLVTLIFLQALEKGNIRLNNAIFKITNAEEKDYQIAYSIFHQGVASLGNLTDVEFWKLKKQITAEKSRQELDKNTATSPIQIHKKGFRL